MESVAIESEALADRIWRQVEHGVDEDLLPTREKRQGPGEETGSRAGQEGWRMFISGCAYTMANGEGPQRRNAEAMLVDLLPERAADLKRIVEVDPERPEPPPRKD